MWSESRGIRGSTSAIQKQKTNKEQEVVTCDRCQAELSKAHQHKKNSKLQMLWSLALLSCLTVSLVSGFLPDLPFRSPQLTQSALSVHQRIDGGNADGSGLWNSDNDFSTFLNQCCIQNFLFLLVSLRDVHTAVWLERNFTKPVLRESNAGKQGKEKVLENMEVAFNNAREEIKSKDQEIKLLAYHGLSAINTTLFPSWNSYFEALLEEEDFTMLIPSANPDIEFEIDVTPSSLCSRLVSVREQIAREFARDLDRIIDISCSFIEQYSEFKEKEQGNEQYRTNLLFLYLPLDGEPAPSPLRKGNFDLLMLFTLQESIHRILNSSECNVGESDLMLLRNFYTEKLDTHFVGPIAYGKADDFLVGLIESPCTVQLDERVDTVDPLTITKLVLQTQAKVALELVEVALEAPNDHLELKRRQLQKLLNVK